MPGVNNGSSGNLTHEMREEIKKLLRGSSDGLEHGAVLRSMEQGLTIDEIALERDSSVASVRAWIRSLDYLFAGAIPDSKSAALKNSYVYRELLNHSLSENLRSYVNARLRDLAIVNADVRMDPLQTRPYQYSKGKRT
jgi:hypothetical protein